MSADGSDEPKPKRLKTLTFEVENSDGNNTLHRLVLDNSAPNKSSGRKHIIARLRSMRGNSVDALNRDGYTALHLAVLKNNPLMVQELLACFEDIDVNRKCGDYKWCIHHTSLHLGAVSALHLAIASGNNHFIIQELLSRGADVNLASGCGRRKYGHTPLCLAARSGDLGVVERLVSQGADVNLLGTAGSALLYALRFVRKDLLFMDRRSLFGRTSAIVDFLAEEGADLEQAGALSEHTPLHSAVLSDELEMVELLVSKGVDLHARDSFGQTPLFNAVFCRNLKIVEFLVDKGVDVNAKDSDGKTALHWATFTESVEVFKLLIIKGFDAVNENGKKCFRKRMALEIVEFLLNNGADVNAVDNDGSTPLYLGILERDLAIVELLVSEGADYRAIHPDGKSMLHCAIDCRAWDIVEFLIGKDSDLNATDKEGRSILHYAVQEKHLNTVELVVNKGGDIRVVDENGRTPLRSAILKRHLEIIRFLVNKNADLLSVDFDEIAYLHSEIRKRHWQFFKFLN